MSPSKSSRSATARRTKPRARKSKPYRILLAHRLTELRNERGWTQLDVAQRLGRVQSFVSKCELGVRLLDLDEINEYALAYEITLKQLLDGLLDGKET